MNALKESEEKTKALNALIRYKKHSIEELQAATEFFADSRGLEKGLGFRSRVPANNII